MLRASVIVCLVVATATAARAEPRLHVGIEGRTDLRTHALRVPLGVDLGRLDVGLVLDPLVLLDGQHDGDATVAGAIGCTRWAWVAGWRLSSFSVAGGHVWQEHSLAGVTAPLAAWRGFEAKVGGEVSVLWVKHGAGLPASWIHVDRSIVDRVHVGMFVRVERGFGL